MSRPARPPSPPFSIVAWRNAQHFRVPPELGDNDSSSSRLSSFAMTQPQPSTGPSPYYGALQPLATDVSHLGSSRVQHWGVAPQPTTGRPATTAWGSAPRSTQAASSSSSSSSSAAAAAAAAAAMIHESEPIYSARPGLGPEKLHAMAVAEQEMQLRAMRRRYVLERLVDTVAKDLHVKVTDQRTRAHVRGLVGAYGSNRLAMRAHRAERLRTARLAQRARIGLTQEKVAQAEHNLDTLLTKLTQSEEEAAEEARKEAERKEAEAARIKLVAEQESKRLAEIEELRKQVEQERQEREKRNYDDYNDRMGRICAEWRSIVPDMKESDADEIFMLERQRIEEEVAVLAEQQQRMTQQQLLQLQQLQHVPLRTLEDEMAEVVRRMMHWREAQAKVIEGRKRAEAAAKERARRAEERERRLREEHQQNEAKRAKDLEQWKDDKRRQQEEQQRQLDMLVKQEKQRVKDLAAANKSRIEAIAALKEQRKRDEEAAAREREIQRAREEDERELRMLAVLDKFAKAAPSFAQHTSSTASKDVVVASMTGDVAAAGGKGAAPAPNNRGKAGPGVSKTAAVAAAERLKLQREQEEKKLQQAELARQEKLKSSQASAQEKAQLLTVRTQEAIRAKEAQQEEDRKRADEKTKERLQRSEANKLRLESERQEQLKRERELRDQATLKAKQTKEDIEAENQRRIAEELRARELRVTIGGPGEMVGSPSYGLLPGMQSTTPLASARGPGGVPGSGRRGSVMLTPSGQGMRQSSSREGLPGAAPSPFARRSINAGPLSPSAAAAAGGRSFQPSELGLPGGGSVDEGTDEAEWERDLERRADERRRDIKASVDKMDVTELMRSRGGRFSVSSSVSALGTVRDDAYDGDDIGLGSRRRAVGADGFSDFGGGNGQDELADESSVEQARARIRAKMAAMAAGQGA